MRNSHLILILLVLFNSCASGQSEQEMSVPRERDPGTPTQEELEALKPISFELLSSKMKPLDGAKSAHVYYLNGELFNGWTLQLFEGNAHRFRYMKMKDGLVEWQIGYYDNGQLDLDFRSENGYGHGSARMWKDDGTPYIDTYYKAGGIQHGKQMRWHPNGQLEWEAMYEDGQLKWEKYYDKEGKLTNLKGNEE